MQVSDSDRFFDLSVTTRKILSMILKDCFTFFRQRRRNALFFSQQFLTKATKVFASFGVGGETPDETLFCFIPLGLMVKPLMRLYFCFFPLGLVVKPLIQLNPKLGVLLRQSACIRNLPDQQHVLHLLITLLLSFFFFSNLLLLLSLLLRQLLLSLLLTTYTTPTNRKMGEVAFSAGISGSAFLQNFKERTRPSRNVSPLVTLLQQA